MKMAGQDIPDEIEASALQTMRPGAGIDYFESWDVSRVLRSFALDRGLDPHRLAGKLLQRERKAGHIRHRGNGQWVRHERG